MSVLDWLRPRQAVVTLTGVAVVSLGALGVLSWQLIEQDGQLEAPRLRGLLEAAADTAVAGMAEELGRLETHLLQVAGPSAANGVSVLRVAAAGTTLVAGAALPFLPTRRPQPEADPAAFGAAEAIEFGSDDVHVALAVYRDLSERGTERAVRATALARLAPLALKAGDEATALRAYDRLAALDDVFVSGLPAALVATIGRAEFFARTGRSAPLRQTAAALADDLARGRWPLLQSEFEFYDSEVRRWLESPRPMPDDLLTRAEAASWLWTHRDTLASAGRRLSAEPHGTALVAWRTAGDGIDVAAAGPGWVANFVARHTPAPFVATLLDLEGRAVHGLIDGGGDVATRLASPDGLPWTVELRVGPAFSQPGVATRSRILLLIAATALVAGAGWFLTIRALARERCVAQLQHDFVSSVSHEFRSPLTSLAQAADLLTHDRLTTDAQRRRVYEMLAGDTARLRDLVEHLLDFGRFEAGAMALRRERVDIGALVADVVRDAERRVREHGYRIDFAPPAEPLMADVDRTALGRAIWNLLDNAIKYSPDCHTIWVEAAREGERITIAVRDEGIGIPADEQPAVFGRFVRGTGSEVRHIPGTGIGLALVRQIIDAHGGTIRLTSEPGHGSRFELQLRSSGGPS